MKTTLALALTAAASQACSFTPGYTPTYFGLGRCRGSINSTCECVETKTSVDSDGLETKTTTTWFMNSPKMVNIEKLHKDGKLISSSTRQHNPNIITPNKRAEYGWPAIGDDKQCGPPT